MVEINFGRVVHAEEGCISDNVDLGDRGKMYSYDLNERRDRFDYLVAFDTWKKKKEKQLNIFSF